ncbi:MAG TPA: hypothetical protein DCP73_13220, partial [Chloroflexi bacterium]|nr:hypothetical protein [Chloroflexota bacterium]
TTARTRIQRIDLGDRWECAAVFWASGVIFVGQFAPSCIRLVRIRQREFGQQCGIAVRVVGIIIKLATACVRVEWKLQCRKFLKFGLRQFGLRQFGPYQQGDREQLREQFVVEFWIIGARTIASRAPVERLLVRIRIIRRKFVVLTTRVSTITEGRIGQRERSVIGLPGVAGSCRAIRTVRPAVSIH